jgi:hypothetical protein
MPAVKAKSVQLSRYYWDENDQACRNVKIETDDGDMEIVFPIVVWALEQGLPDPDKITAREAVY